MLSHSDVIKRIKEGRWHDLADIRSRAYSWYVEALNCPTFTISTVCPIMCELKQRIGLDGFPIIRPRRSQPQRKRERKKMTENTLPGTK